MDEYGHFIGCIEKPTPMSAADLQMLGLPTYKRHTEAELIWAIEEQLGPCKTWKKYMAKLFWQAKMTNQDMMKVVTFCIGNGLDPRLLREWLDGRGVRYDAHKMNCDLNEAISWAKNDDPTNCPFFYHDLIKNEWCLLTGHLRNGHTGGVKPPKEDFPWAYCGPYL